MGKSLEQLKKDKEMLLKKAGLKTANLESLRARDAEKRKLKAEIFALKNPGSVRARSQLSSAVKSFGKSVRTRANIVAENAVRIENKRRELAREERMKERELQLARARAASKRNSSVKKKAPVRRKATTKRRKRK